MRATKAKVHPEPLYECICQEGCTTVVVEKCSRSVSVCLAKHSSSARCLQTTRTNLRQMSDTLAPVRANHVLFARAPLRCQIYPGPLRLELSCHCGSQRSQCMKVLLRWGPSSLHPGAIGPRPTVVHSDDNRVGMPVTIGGSQHFFFTENSAWHSMLHLRRCEWLQSPSLPVDIDSSNWVRHVVF